MEITHSNMPITIPQVWYHGSISRYAKEINVEVIHYPERTAMSWPDQCNPLAMNKIAWLHNNTLQPLRPSRHRQQANLRSKPDSHKERLLWWETIEGNHSFTTATEMLQVSSTRAQQRTPQCFFYWLYVNDKVQIYVSCTWRESKI